MREVIGLKTMGAGFKFGKWTTLGEFKKIGTKRCEKCVCECGTIRFVKRESLLSGKSTSCCCYKMPSIGDFRGEGRTRFYNIRHDLWHRCNNPKRDKYYRYGGRGIKVIRKDYGEFKQDMYESYLKHISEYGEKNTTIDRIDVNGNYCKENCRRATMKEQCNNKTTCKFFTFDGITKNINQRAEYINLNRLFVRDHLLKGEDINFIIGLGKQKNIKPFKS